MSVIHRLAAVLSITYSGCVQSLAKPTSSFHSLLVLVLIHFGGVAVDTLYPAMLAGTEPISAFATPSLVHP
jgi:hypothetical protein